MPLKTPKFWYRDNSRPAPFWECFLAPLSKAYNAAHRWNQNSKTPYTSCVPVICVGNAVAGGSGKTPTAIAIQELLQHEKPNTFFLTRGYKGAIKQTTLVDFALHSAEQVGDETMILARHASTIKSIHRPDGLKLAEVQNADLVIMDDGLQNNSVSKTISFCVIDGETGFGNGKTIPAGPLREELSAILSKIDGLILIGEDKTGIKVQLETQKPVFGAKIEAKASKNTQKVVAFAGLGRPEKFKSTLETLGYEVAGWHEFPDHHPYSDHDLYLLRHEAERIGARLITTEKDAARISDPETLELLDILPIKVVFDDELALKSFIMEHLPR